MKLTEKQMCLSCWYWIYLRIESGNFDSVRDMKEQYFLSKYYCFGLSYNCLFCTYCKSCKDCPLNIDLDCACYRLVEKYTQRRDTSNEGKQNALYGCWEIIKALNDFPIDGKKIDFKRRKNERSRVQ